MRRIVERPSECGTHNRQCLAPVLQSCGSQAFTMVRCAAVITASHTNRRIMSIYKDKIVVVDIEATCWKGYTAPPGQENEIIEIGLCLLDPRAGTVSDKRSIMVKPIESEVSEFCTELTGITQQEVDEQGLAFETACAILERTYNTRNRLWASWGAFDRKLLALQCKRREVRYPFSKNHANLKQVFQRAHGKRLPFAMALQAYNVEQIGNAHRGDDDAFNTAHLLNVLMQQHGDLILKKYGW